MLKEALISGKELTAVNEIEIVSFISMSWDLWRSFGVNGITLRRTTYLNRAKIHLVTAFEAATSRKNSQCVL